MHGFLEQRWLATASHGAALWGRCPSTPRTLATMRLRPRPRLRARAKDRSLDRKLLFLRCDPEQYSTLLWPPVTCNHSWIRQELACYTGALAWARILTVLVWHPLRRLYLGSNSLALPILSYRIIQKKELFWQGQIWLVRAHQHTGDYS